MELSFASLNVTLLLTECIICNLDRESPLLKVNELAEVIEWDTQSGDPRIWKVCTFSKQNFALA